jgi:nicotinamide-nucleotide amidase
MTLEEQVGALLVNQGLTLATAESCTGGLVAHRITNVSGSSAYYLGGFVTYSNASKEAFLGVRHKTLMAHGAVSEETAREMARGARLSSGADIAISITGIAGPTGGTPEKPVGLVYIALSSPAAEICQRHLWQGDRLSNKEQSAEAALRLIVNYMQKRSSGMVEFVNEPINVEVQLRPDGTSRPLAFVWRGRRLQITSWGRQSAEAQDESARQCHLVQTADLETWELCQDTTTAAWMLVRHWAQLRRAV